MNICKIKSKDEDILKIISIDDIIYGTYKSITLDIKRERYMDFERFLETLRQSTPLVCLSHDSFSVKGYVGKSYMIKKEKCEEFLGLIDLFCIPETEEELICKYKELSKNYIHQEGKPNFSIHWSYTKDEWKMERRVGTKAIINNCFTDDEIFALNFLKRLNEANKRKREGIK